MQFITLAAHFDGERIILDEPFKLSPNTPLIVTVLPDAINGTDSPWSDTAAMGLAHAYGDHEPEYTLQDIK
jgi:hypothetical protein